jgi:ribonuclease P protein component
MNINPTRGEVIEKARRCGLFTVSLKKWRDFKQAYAHRKSVGTHMLVMYVRANERAVNRLGVSVSRKVGKAVTRNRVKRCIKAQYRLREHALKTGYDMVISVRPAAGALARGADFLEIGKSLHYLYKKHGLYKTG